MKEYNLKHYAYIGDAVWEVFIREIVINTVNTQLAMHKMATGYVNAGFQAECLEKTGDDLTLQEKELVKRGLNLPLTTQKRGSQNIHRHATAFEALIGFLYLNNKTRLCEIFEIIRKKALQ